MLKDAFAELVAECAHLGRLPKPIIVRPKGAGYEIVDGEHGWRAAVALDWPAVPCEIVDVDDFEARRETYKRNQHGSHHKVREGQLFRQMMTVRGLSRRDFAKNIGVSEGTIRNALLYDAAAALRNGYAFEQLTVRQVRAYLRLPRVLADAWLECGAELWALPDGSKTTRRESRAHQSSSLGEHEDDNLGTQHWFSWLAEARLLEFFPRCSNAPAFRKGMEQLEKWDCWERGWCVNGLTRSRLRPYTVHHFRAEWVVRESYMMDFALDANLDPSTTPPGFILSADEFAAVIQDAPIRGDDTSELFDSRLRAAIQAKSGRAPTRGRTQVLLQEIETLAPDYIKESRLPLHEQHAVWKTADGPLTTLTAGEIEGVRRKLARLERLDRRPGEDLAGAVGRAFSLASREKEARAQYEASTEAELAVLVARAFPLYDADTDSEAIATLAATLGGLTKVELIVLAQVAEKWVWEGAMVVLLRTLRDGG
jgi:ParB-like chromosome segregation protein Spo0J